MKRKFLWSCIIIVGMLSCKMQAQEQNLFDKYTLQVGGGASYPAKPAKDFFHKAYIGSRSFYIGGRYDLDELWGLRLSYGFNKFKNKNRHNSYLDLSLTQHKFVGEFTFNIVRAAQRGKPHTQNNFELVAHSGLGLSLGKSGFLSGVDKTLTYQIGLMPTYKLSRYFSVQVDMAMILDFFQAYDIDGIPISDKVGNYYLANIGVAYSFGR